MSNHNMEADSIFELVKLVFGGSGPPRGRLFITCITKEEILIVTDRRPHPRLSPPIYTNVFVPTICGDCVGLPGSQRGAAGNFELGEGFIHKSDAFEAIKDWCGGGGGGITYMRLVEPRELIMKECRKYGVQMQSARAADVGGGCGVKVLDVLPFYDPAFA